MSEIVSPRAAVQRMAAYVPPTERREGKLRLDFNENTVGCSPRVAEFLSEVVTREKIAVYPEYSAARAELATNFAVRREEILLTNGTDEAIQILINTYVDPGDEVIILHPSYAMYRFYAEVAGASLIQLAYRADTLAFPFEEILNAISPRTRAILLSNPNNPTGTAIAIEQVAEIVQRAPGAVVLVDEAYYEFYGLTALPLLSQHPNLFVSRTFSKAYGMAGLRLGCLFSDARNLVSVHKAQSPYSVNILAAMAARVAITDYGYIKNYVGEVLAARDLLVGGLKELGISFHDSAGNFVLMRLGERAGPVRDQMRKAGVLVRDRSHEIPGTLRVTVGTRQQMERFLTELKRILGNS